MSNDPPEPKKKTLEAIPIQRDTLRKARLEVQDLPLAAFPVRTSQVESVLAESIEQRDDDPKRSVLPSNDTPRQEPEARTPAFQQPPVVEKKEVSINRKALESTNRGKKPSSRRFVRGILYPSPVKVTVSAFFAIAVRVALLGAVILGVLILFDKVDVRWAWALLALPVIALFYFATVGNVRCRVCGVKEFVPSGSLKHVKTHRFMFLGPIVSTALHLLLFKWFHCMFCGTAVRIKK